MMKRHYTYMVMAVVALSATMLTACNRDAEEANTLNGQWTGYISTYYEDRWGLTGEDYRTTICFVQRDMYGGTGYEVDYDVRDPYGSYYYSPIRWSVNNGIINIYYSYDDYYVEISRYTLNSNAFSGYMYDGTRRDIYFSLSYVGNVDWDRYRNGPNWRRSAATDSDDVVVNGESVARGAFARSILQR